jgi:chromosome segregation ATPase
MAFDPGQPLTRDLIAADPDGALGHIEQLAQRANSAEELVAELRNQLQAHETGIAEAERRAADSAQETESLRQQLVDGQAQHSSILTGQAEAVQAYRDLVLKAEPQLPPELISGGTLGEITASIEKARAVVSHVQAALQRSNAASVVPAGAPMRSLAPDTEQMSAQDKLLYGVQLARDPHRADVMSG